MITTSTSALVLEATEDVAAPITDWQREIAEAYSGDTTSDAVDTAAWGYVTLAAPLVARGAARLDGVIVGLGARWSPLPFDPETVVEVMAAPLFASLAALVTRTLVLEMHAARLAGRVTGDTSAERFDAFLRSLTRPEVARAVLDEYPELARALVIRVDQWVRTSTEFLERLCRDHDLLRATFASGAELGPLVEYSGGAGDRHRDGRSVAVVRFGGGLRIGYKPRSLGVDARMQEMLGWLNARGARPALRTLTVLDRGAYGWIEFIEAEPCADRAGVRRFYERQGMYMALLAALRASDFHRENVIAAGEHPMLIDLESVLAPRLLSLGPADLAAEAAERSVLRLELLPRKRGGRGDRPGVDISGLGGEAGQEYPAEATVLDGAGTDEARFVQRTVTMPESAHRPTLDGDDVQAAAHLDDIERGFRSMHRLLLAHRAELLADNGPLARFAEVETRAILRATRTYAHLLSEACHPDLLRDAAERHDFFAKLRDGARIFPSLARVIDAELADLDRGDVPVFTTRPGSRDLWTSDGVRVENYVQHSGLDLAVTQLHALDDRECGRQVALIRSAFAVAAGDAPTTPRSSIERRDRRPDADLLAEARRVGNTLLDRAIRRDGCADWLGYVLTEAGPTLHPMSMNLYDGLPGVALFLAYLGDVTGDERYTVLARETLTTMRRRMANRADLPGPVGAFNGCGGLIYLYAHLGALWNDAHVLDEAAALAEALPARIAKDGELDVVGGAAGCIGALLALHAVAPSERLLRIASAAGERLLATARPAGSGLGWVSERSTGPALAGFSHGGAGFAWALLRLAGVSGDRRFRAAAGEALAHERALFSREAANWPDLRTAEPTFVSLWCHGAPGVGLARLDTLDLLDNAEVRGEIVTAVGTTLRDGFGGTHILCHGELGNLDLIARAAAVLDRPDLHAETRRRADAIMDDIQTHGWRTGCPAGAEALGLMTGIAGIGYAVLRLVAPNRVPSVLTLQPPHTRA